MPLATDSTKKATPKTRPTEMEAQAAKAAAGLGLTIEVPFKPCPEKYAQRGIHITLDLHQASALRYVFEGLEVRRAALRDGHRVQGPQDAIRWLLEAVEDAAK